MGMNRAQWSECWTVNGTGRAPTGVRQWTAIVLCWAGMWLIRCGGRVANGEWPDHFSMEFERE
jgi:hypothetical protein